MNDFSTGVPLRPRRSPEVVAARKKKKPVIPKPPKQKPSGYREPVFTQSGLILLGVFGVLAALVIWVIVMGGHWTQLH